MNIHDAHDPLDIEQTVLTLGHGQSATLGHGVQNISYNFKASDVISSPTTISPPLGRLSTERPLRGRQDLIARLQEGSENGRIGGVHVVYGLAGSGKTSVALEIASHAVKSGVHTWWVAGNSASSLAMGMRSLAGTIGATEIEFTRSDPADVLWRRLNGLDQEWLLIVDNVDDPSVLDGNGDFVDGTGWVRPSVAKSGGVLITTRLATPSAWGTWCSMNHTTMLDEDDGAKMLFDYVPSSAGSLDEAKRLVRRLGGLPLAIRLAGLYLAETNSIPWQEPDSIATISDYHHTMDEGLIPGAESRDTLAQAWRLSLQLLDDRGYEFARQTLYLACLFADTVFPFRTVFDPTVLGSCVPFEGINGAVLWRTINALADLGMVDLVHLDLARPSPEYFRVHPMVRDITRIGSPPNADGTTYLEIAAALIHKALIHGGPGQDDEAKTWARWGYLAPHVTALTRLASSPMSTLPVIQELGPVWCSLTDYLVLRAMLADGEELARLSLNATERHSDTQAAGSLHRRLHLALVLQSRTKYQEADSAYLAILHDSELTYGPNSLEFANMRHHYADSLRERGEYEASERVLRQALSVETRLLGDKDEVTLTTRDCLARLLRSKGDLQAALLCYSDVLEARTEILGKDHDDTMYTRHHYAHTLSALGRLDEAEELHRKLLDDQISKSGPNAWAVLNNRHCLSHLLSSRGDIVGALKEVRIALDGRRRIFGDDNPSTLELRSCVASLLRFEEPEAAKLELNSVIEMLQRTLGREHSQTLSARHDLAHTISNSGDSVGAQRAFLEVYNLQLRILGAKHSATRQTKACLDAEKRKASARIGSFPLHGGGKSRGRKKGR